MKIAIVGLDCVGLPLSLQFTRAGVTVLGLDIDPAKVASTTRNWPIGRRASWTPAM
jgi:UDP-N-acetyl-D-mannosaminuronate dehydrogenase